MDALLHLGLSNAVLASLLAVLVAFVAAVCRRPALAHALWLLVLLKLLTPPLLPVALPWPAPGAAPAVPPPPVHADPAPAPPLQALRFPDVAPRGGERPAPPPEGAAATSLSWQGAVGVFWLAGSCLWWAVAATRVAQFRRLLRLAVPAPAATQEQARRLAARLGLARCPEVALVPACVSPLLWALGRAPRLLLPAELWQRLTPEQRDTLLVHELAHLRRGDPWVRRLELLALGLYWWHPVAWWARRELTAAAEECCDAWVVWALPEAAPAYATALVETIAFLSRARRPVPLAASGAGHLGAIKRRLTMILRGPRPRTLSGAGALAVFGLAAVLLPLLPTWAEQPSPEQAAVPTHPAAGAPTGGSPESPRAESPPTPKKTAARTPAALDSALADEVQRAKDEVELIEAQRVVKRAHLEVARIALSSAEDFIRRLVQAGGAVTLADRIQAEQEAARLKAQVRIKEAELREPEVRLRQALRRLAALEQRAHPSVDPTADQGWAESLFDRGLTLNCGTVQRGIQFAYEFELTNKTKGPVRIDDVRSSSAAVIVKHFPAEVKPGQRRQITGTVDTSRLDGNKTLLFHVHFSHPRAAVVKLALRVNSVSGKQVPPLPEEGNRLTDRERFLDLEKKLGDILKEMESLRKRLPAAKPAGDQLEVNALTFEVPIHIQEGRGIRELRVFCSPNEGGSWQEVVRLLPSQRSFRYVAPGDGVYWFNVATVDQAGKESPPDITRQPPALRVRVNTARTD